MIYTCEQCDKLVDDHGPYERSDGEYQCQGCMESNECAAELHAEMDAEAREEAIRDNS